MFFTEYVPILVVQQKRGGWRLATYAYARARARDASLPVSGNNLNPRKNLRRDAPIAKFSVCSCIFRSSARCVLRHDRPWIFSKFHVTLPDSRLVDRRGFPFVIATRHYGTTPRKTRPEAAGLRRSARASVRKIILFFKSWWIVLRCIFPSYTFVVFHTYIYIYIVPIIKRKWRAHDVYRLFEERVPSVFYIFSMLFVSGHRQGI